jgi:DHA1 family multidrug resistance protein-like MFS transporter
MSIALQYPVMRFMDKRFAPATTLVIGIAVMTAGLGLVALANDIGFMLMCVALYSLGGLLASPSQQTVAADLANSTALGSYFGVAGLAIAFGGGMGSFSGGTLYGLGQSWNHPEAPWLIFMTVGMITALALATFFGRHKLLTKPIRE